jgi:hypothetical protein
VAAIILTAWTVYGLVHAAYWITTAVSRERWGWMLLSALVMAWTWAAPASEAAIGLAILVVLFRNTQSINVEALATLKE